VGIVAGHHGPENDPGAVCEDGLQEADVNLRVAEQVVAALSRRGFQAELLEEFDERLLGYRAEALLAIHADSCIAGEATGFKVARVLGSAIPEVEDALVSCLRKEYGRITGLAYHEQTITPDMHAYHAFLEIDPRTPGAIIEMGFLGADKDLLVNHPEKVAEGVFAGLVCFLER
jgi:N-acetylmuramoyl-L-alanine amidase